MRVKEIDIARGFTVFIMAAVHALMIYSKPEVYVSWLGKIFFFLAEGPGAPLFMMLMGISFVLSARKSLSQIFRRAAILFVCAYVLNFLKFLLPLFAGAIPDQLLLDFGIAPGSSTIWHLLLLGDILQLAAFSLIILALLQRLRHFHYWAIILAFIVMLVTPTLWQVSSSNPFINYLCDLGWGYNPRVYFPVLPWVVYPLVGMAAGRYLKTSSHFFNRTAILGLLLISIGLVICSFDPAFHWGDFYRTGQGGTIYHTGFVLVWLYLCHLALKILPDNLFFKLLCQLSRHITRIYLLQWTIIFWLVGVIGYRQLGIWYSVVCIVVITGLVIALALSPALIRKVQVHISVRLRQKNESIALMQTPEQQSE